MAHGLTDGLRLRGHDVLTTLDAVMTGVDDETQLAFAVQQGRAIYTFNVGDYLRLHAAYLSEGKEHAGIIVVSRRQLSIGEQLKRLSHLLNTKTADEMRNAVEFLG